MKNLIMPDDLTVRGHSIVPLLEGEEPAWDNNLYAEYSMRHGATVDMRAWRTPEWKLMIDFRHPGREELYDLANDPAEAHNLIDSKSVEIQEVRQELASRIHAKLAEIQDPELADVWESSE